MQQEQDRPTRVTLRASRQDAGRSRAAVLVVEDSEDDFFLLQRVFRKLAPDVEITRLDNGSEALKYFDGAKQTSAVTPALLLLDLKLPGVSGFEILKAVRSEPVFASVAINILSSSAEPSDVRQAFSLGANAYTVKPISLNEYEEVMGGLFNFWFKCSHLPARDRL